MALLCDMVALSSLPHPTRWQGLGKRADRHLRFTGRRWGNAGGGSAGRATGLRPDSPVWSALHQPATPRIRLPIGTEILAGYGSPGRAAKDRGAGRAGVSKTESGQGFGRRFQRWHGRRGRPGRGSRSAAILPKTDRAGDGEDSPELRRHRGRLQLSNCGAPAAGPRSAFRL